MSGRSNWWNENPIKLHVIYVSPDWVSERGINFNAKEFVSKVKGIGVNCVEIYTKDHQGYCYYRTDWGKRYRRDILNELIDAAKPEGVKIITYYSVGFDGWAENEYPEWRCVDAKGDYIKSYDPEGSGGIRIPRFHWLCLHSPYMEYMLTQIQEIAEGYETDGFWFDIMGFPGAYAGQGNITLTPRSGCYCGHCLSKYRLVYGEEIPKAAAKKEDQLKLFNFRHRTRALFMERVKEITARYRPNALITFNHSGQFRERPELRKTADFLTTEAHILPPEGLMPLSLRAKYMSSQGRPYEVTTPGSWYSWSDWSLVPPNLLRLEVAIALAHSGTITIGENPGPDGSIREAEFENLGRVTKWVEEREELFKDATSFRDIAVVDTYSSELASMLSEDEYRQPPEIDGFHNALASLGVHFDIINEENPHMGDYRLLIFPDRMSISPETRDRLARYVKRGGKLLLSYRTSLFNRMGEIEENFSLSEAMGLNFTNFSRYSTNYIQLKDKGLSSNQTWEYIPFRYRAVECELISGKSLGFIVYQDGEVTNSRFLMWNTDNYLGKETSYPAITINKLGDGECMYIAFPIGRGIVEMRNGNYSNLLLAMVQRLLGRGLIKGDHPPGVQFVLNRQGERFVLHMLNHHVGALGCYGDDERMAALAPFKLKVDMSRIGVAKEVEFFPRDKGFSWRIRGSWLEMDIPKLAIHSAVTIEG